LIEQGGVQVGGERVSDPLRLVTLEDAAFGTIELRVGKKKRHIVRAVGPR